MDMDPGEQGWKAMVYTEFEYDSQVLMCWMCCPQWDDVGRWWTFKKWSLKRGHWEYCPQLGLR